MSKVGRNDACPCGSGKKSKRCCEVAPAGASTRTRLIVIAAGAAIAAAIIGGVMSSDREGTGSNRVWSAEHGHYHDM